MHGSGESAFVAGETRHTATHSDRADTANRRAAEREATTCGTSAPALRAIEHGAAAYDANAPALCTVALEVAYDGAPFSGFARQPGQLTVQGELERALALLFRRPVETVCAGRTDAGVHARSQVVSLELSPEERDARAPRRLAYSLNGLTDERIAVRGVAWARTGFSARFDAIEREYRYFISESPARPVLAANRIWHLKHPLDLAAMRAGAAHLIGEHDFKSFCLKASAEGKPTCRNVRAIGIDRTEVFGDPTVVITVRGNAFLHSMVRTITGTLVAVGLGRRDADWVAEALAARDRRAAGECAPAHGLVFWKVRYPEGLLDWQDIG